MLVDFDVILDDEVKCELYRNAGNFPWRMRGAWEGRMDRRQAKACTPTSADVKQAEGCTPTGSTRQRVNRTKARIAIKTEAGSDHET